MQDYTGDNRQAQVFHSHPITVKGIFLARNSPRSTMRVSQRNKISPAFRALSRVARTKEKKSDPVYSTPARAISRRWLNKDSSNWGANRDGKHLLFALGPCWPWGFCLWSVALANHLPTRAQMKQPLRHTRRVREKHTRHWQKLKCKHTNKQAEQRFTCAGKKTDVFGYYTNLKNIFFKIYSVNGLLFLGAEKWKNARRLSFSRMKKYDISTFPAEASQTPHSTVGQTPPLDCQSRCCISPTCDGKMIH